MQGTIIININPKKVKNTKNNPKPANVVLSNAEFIDDREPISDGIKIINTRINAAIKEARIVCLGLKSNFSFANPPIKKIGTRTIARKTIGVTTISFTEKILSVIKVFTNSNVPARIERTIIINNKKEKIKSFFRFIELACSPFSIVFWFFSEF